MYYDDDRHTPEVHEWCYRLMSDPEYFEQWRFKDAIDDYNMIIGECQKLYEKTPATTTAEDRFIHDKSLATIKRAQRELAETLAEYDKFKEYKARTAISK